MMNWILIVMVMMVLVVIAVTISGLMLPVRMDVDRSVELNVPRTEVWRMLRAVETISDWCPVLPLFEVTAEQPSEMLLLRLRNDSHDVVAEWKVSFEEDGNGTRLSVHESSVTTNPIARFIRGFASRSARVDIFLQGIARQLRQSTYRGASPDRG